MRDSRRRRAIAIIVGAAFALPLLAIVLRAFADEWRAPAIFPKSFGLRGVSEAFSGQALDGFANSLIVAVTVTAIALVLGWPAARVLGERRLRHPAPVFLMLALPILVPSYATANGLTEWFVRLNLVDSVSGIALAHLVIVLPYVTLILMAGFGPRLTALEEMGRSQGLGRVRLWLLVTAPSVKPTLAAAALLGFLVSWGEYGASLAIGGGKAMLPVVLLPFIGPDPQVAAAISLLFLAPALVALFVSARATKAAA